MGILGNLKTPYFIDDGGYFPDGTKFIGIVNENTECYVPVTSKEDASVDLTELTRAELVTKVQNKGMNDVEGNPRTSEEIETHVNSWCDNRNVE